LTEVFGLGQGVPGAAQRASVRCRPTDDGPAGPKTRSSYQTIDEHWPTFSELPDEHGGVPRFVEREFEAYLKCGVQPLPHLAREGAR
jgi:hypothetical protein